MSALINNVPFLIQDTPNEQGQIAADVEVASGLKDSYLGVRIVVVVGGVS